MNRWEGKGGLTRDAELRYSDSGFAQWGATIAVNGTRYDSQQRQQVVKTTYVRLVAFGAHAEELAEMNLSKGTEILAVGELSQHEKTAEDGTKERKTSVLVWTLSVTRRPAGPSVIGKPYAAQPPPSDDPWDAGNAGAPF